MEVSVFGPLSAVVSHSGPVEAAQKTVVLLHGYGAPGTDLVGLAFELSPKVPTRFVFPFAPLALDPSAPPSEGGRAWWDIDMMELQYLRMTGQDEVLSSRRPEGLERARAQLKEFLAALMERYELRPESLVLGGFSQGAMLSMDYALHREHDLSGLVLLSGTIIDAPTWRERMSQVAPLPVFQSHAPDDMVLPYSLAQKLAADLKDSGYPHEWVSFRGGHGIGPSVMDGLRSFLAARARG